jgi:adenosylmethionine-8-amino-7-oxononanoate aminotransferase
MISPSAAESAHADDEKRFMHGMTRGTPSTLCSIALISFFCIRFASLAKKATRRVVTFSGTLHTKQIFYEQSDDYILMKF